MAGDLTAAQRAAAIARLEQIERILLQVPELANPQGFEIRPQFYGGGSRQLGPGQTEQPGNVIEYMLLLGFYVPTKAIAGEGCACITVTVNNRAPVGPGAYRDAQGRDIYVEAPRGEPIPLATQVHDKLSPTERSIVNVLFTSGGELPWKTVTREEFYAAAILDYEGKDGKNMADFRKSLGKTPYQEWLDGAAERRTNREQTLRSAAQFQTAAEVEKLRQLLEATEREVTEQLRATEAADRERNQAALAASHARTDAMRAELEAMTSARRKMPALIDMTLSAGPISTGWRLTDADSPNAWRILTPDYDFWRARRSPVEVRSITIHIGASLTGQIPVVHNALWQTYKKLDWAAFNKLLDMPR